MKPKIIPIAKVWKSEANGWVYHRGGVSPTICAGCHAGVMPRIADTSFNNKDMGKIYRIRKLTPRECFRLMGCTDSDISKIQNYPLVMNNDGEFVEPEGIDPKDIKRFAISESQQYKMAGNSIVVQCLEGIFRNMFRKDEYHHDTLF